jgi:SAM-dependent methyltransferase
MQMRFSLFSSHLDLAHQYWAKHLRPEDTAIDATCGNGRDTLALAKLLPRGRLIGLDIQPQALENTKALLKKNLPPEALDKISLFQQSHTDFPVSRPVHLIVYNLGYLPGSNNKEFTTLEKSTLESLSNALEIIDLGGVISLTTYPGHAEGYKEHTACLNYLTNLNPKTWGICHHNWPNAQNAPNLFLIQKSR